VGIDCEADQAEVRDVRDLVHGGPEEMPLGRVGDPHVPRLLADERAPRRSSASEVGVSNVNGSGESVMP